MLSFAEYLNERVLSIGLKADHEQHREKHRAEIHDMLRAAYEPIGGYGGNESGSKAESDAIHHDISNSIIKATKRDGKISSVNLYKDQHGRKSIASATDGSAQGKKDFMSTKGEDHTQKRAWGEVSGKVSHLHSKIGTPDIPASRAKELLGKDVKPHADGVHYDRKIGDHEHTKKMVGHPKK
ncbi:MAG: hypothetical protein ACYDG4_18100 [Desulfuromonadaceae bacterium]|jgi:hypothetical protein